MTLKFEHDAGWFLSTSSGPYPIYIEDGPIDVLDVCVHFAPMEGRYDLERRERAPCV